MEVLNPFVLTRFSCRRGLVSALLFLGSLLHGEISFSKPKIDEDAKRFSSLLTPMAPATSPQKDVGAISRKMISLLEALQRASRTNGPSPDSLISKAIGFRSDIGRYESMMLTSSLLNNWREANSLGLFNDAGKFSYRIERGRGAGGLAAFELVVPAEIYPPASNQLANLRLVAEGDRRKPDTPLTAREAAFKGQLVKIIEERQEHAAQKEYANEEVTLPDKGETNAMGETKAEQDRLWKEAVEKAGADTVAQMPEIRVRGKMVATPSRMNENRWRVKVYVENLSSHPTHVEANVWILGTTSKNRYPYIMSETAHPLKLRPKEARMLDLYTNSESSYRGKADDLDQLSKEERGTSKVRYRGFAVSVEHSKGVAAFTGSDQRLSGYVDPASKEPSPLFSMPQF